MYSELIFVSSSSGVTTYLPGSHGSSQVETMKRQYGDTSGKLTLRQRNDFSYYSLFSCPDYGGKSWLLLVNF